MPSPLITMAIQQWPLPAISQAPVMSYVQGGINEIKSVKPLVQHLAHNKWWIRVPI